MQSRLITVLALVVSLCLILPDNADAQRRTIGSTKSNAGETDKKDGSSKDKLKSFKETVKDKVVIEGLFTYYHDTTDNTMLMAITAKQFGPLYLCSETRTGAEGARYDNASMSNTFPFYFKRIGERVQMLERNLRFRADTTAALSRAVGRSVSDHLFGAADIKSKPQDSTGAVLVDATELFLTDAENVSYFFGKQGKSGFSFDKKNSYIETIKSFPENSEIDVKLHYASSQPFSAPTMQSSYSFFHTYHFSLSALPETDYVPRIADDRVGHFLTLYEDYTSLDAETPFVRYVERWNLKKKNPEARLSEPVQPIVFWIENSVPVEYRDAVAEGIEFWNKSFEKIGFRNAIVAEQMPDDADWDPADVRYNTVRWMIVPGDAYAVGPSRANPFTGQIYDADIRVAADFIRFMFLNMEYYIDPVSFNGHQISEQPFSPQAQVPVAPEFGPGHPRFCNYGSESAKEAAFGLAYLLASIGDFTDKNELTKEYVHSYIVELVAHEVGHTLGFRHNFKASSIYNLDQINDRDFTRQHSSIGTVMDYNPPNIAGKGRTQGEFYASTPGPYDDWAIEYAYADFGATTPEEELPQLKKIASRAATPELAYGTDEDAFGNSAKSIDPQCNLFDLGNDPIAYCEHKIGLSNELWQNSLSKFETEGDGYQRVMRAFSYGWRGYNESTIYASKLIGGLYHRRDHVGDPGGTIPFTPVPAAEQRQAMQFLKDRIFSCDGFLIPSDVLNKLQPERFPDFMWSVFSVPQVDFPIHQYALSIQNTSLSMLYSPYILGRLVNNQERYAPGAERYTIYDMFTDVRQAIWSEATVGHSVNSFRRQLQMQHLNWIIAIYLSSAANYPYDALTLAANDLDILEGAVGKSLNASSLDGMTQAHYKEVLRQIKAAKNAERDYAGANRGD